MKIRRIMLREDAGGNVSVSLVVWSGHIPRLRGGIRRYVWERLWARVYR